MARRDHSGVQLYTRNGYDFAYRFPRIVEAVAKLPVQSCFIDGEAIAIEGIVSKRRGSPYRSGGSSTGSRSRTQPRQP
jgi:ATP-dependent DNA ligase